MYNNQLADQPLYPIGDSDDMLYQAPPIPNQEQVYSNDNPNTINTTMSPQNYIPISNTPSQIINQPIESYQYLQKSVGAQNSLELAELLEDLAEVKKASVLKYFQEGCCGICEKHKYRISIINNDESSRYIFICRTDYIWFPLINSYQYDRKMKYIPRDSTDAILDTKDFNKRLIDFVSNFECEYKPRMLVKSTDNNTIIGRIQQPRICHVVAKMQILKYILDIVSQISQNMSLQQMEDNAHIVVAFIVVVQGIKLIF